MNLNSPEAVLSPECVLLTTLNYVLDDITAKMTPDLSKFKAPTSYVKDKGEELVVRLFENSNLSLSMKNNCAPLINIKFLFKGMYGSSEELAENVKIYRSSPGSGLYADANGYLLYPYYTTPVIYRSLKDEQYLCKSDAYIVLQNLTLEVYPFEKPQVLRVLLAIFLRSQELKNLKRMEFLKFDQKDFASIKKEIEKEIKSFGTDPAEFFPMMAEITNLAFPDLHLRFKNLVKVDWGEPEAAFFERILRRYVLEFHVAPNFKYLLTILYSTAERIINLLKKIIDNRLEIFLLGGPRPTVRLFEDHGGRQLVMKAELFNAINKPTNLIKNGFDEICFEAMTMEDVQKQFGDQIKDIEFIRLPILRAKDKAVPLQGPLNNREFFVLAIDAFFDLMRNVILGVKLFQKIPHWGVAEPICVSWYLAFKHEELKKFVHNQKGCSRVYALKCNECESKPKASEIQKTFEDLKITKETSESSKKAPEASPPLQKFPEPTITQKESKNCEKCFRTCEMLNEAKKELKSNENRIKNLEKKLSTKEKKLEEFEDQKQKIQEKEKEIQEKLEEIEQLKGKVEKSLKIAEDNGKLISEVTKLTDSIAELNEEHSKQTEKFLESQNQQFDKISHLEYELDMARQTTEILNQKILELENQRAENENWEAEKQNLHLEIQENRGKIKEFYDENIRMRTENEVNQRMIQQLLDKLSSATSSGNSYSNPPVATSGRDYSNPVNYRRPESLSSGSKYSNPRPTVS
ncbi:Protein CBG25521 [Caenorhabditis briggsae]|uniref:Protein CBG25521 n=1 Tax=Caenorhabditis briggsae TaxID=6238 RepID=B6IFP6_CAEBR|nr:Protein CBG25521 [Caenorhabditis briggsae]CAR98726.1 Protein CBG25521 [Caenorhabditis briggsae]